MLTILSCSGWKYIPTLPIGSGSGIYLESPRPTWLASGLLRQENRWKHPVRRRLVEDPGSDTTVGSSFRTNTLSGLVLDSASDHKWQHKWIRAQIWFPCLSTISRTGKDSITHNTLTLLTLQLTQSHSRSCMEEISLGRSRINTRFRYNH